MLEFSGGGEASRTFDRLKAGTQSGAPFGELYYWERRGNSYSQHQEKYEILKTTSLRYTIYVRKEDYNEEDDRPNRHLAHTSQLALFAIKGGAPNGNGRAIAIAHEFAFNCSSIGRHVSYKAEAESF
ncbi:hypothetical protein HPP92_026277 [Vanilla planifolia]|uniref:Uncharacterized protein n=1 Tax=Vanilla planifolia TaxID=51239 RepID=A0A835U6V6_VANPL|nr:hypothetical protein HPP92_026277 [Vanilla planifolia]